MPQRFERPSRSRSTPLPMRRSRVSGVLAPSIGCTNHCFWLFESPSKKRRASGAASSACAKSSGRATSRGGVELERDFDLVAGGDA